MKCCITVTQLYLDIQCSSCLRLQKVFSSFSALEFTVEVSLCNKSSMLINSPNSRSEQKRVIRLTALNQSVPLDNPVRLLFGKLELWIFKKIKNKLKKRQTRFSSNTYNMFFLFEETKKGDWISMYPVLNSKTERKKARKKEIKKETFHQQQEK